jgi:hypothetical protein
MSSTKESRSKNGYDIRESHSNEKEKSVCDMYNLQQVGGNRTKVDGTNENLNVSIKNTKSSSTQVHLTTQKKFIEKFKLEGNCEQYVELFCGNPLINNKGKDRYTNYDIPNEIKEDFLLFLNDKKMEIIDYIISNGCNITLVIWRDLNKEIDYQLTYDQIMTKIENCTWVFIKGGVHLKNENKKTYFHFQRESKSGPNNRYNVLWHIHKNLFL